MCCPSFILPVITESLKQAAEFVSHDFTAFCDKFVDNWVFCDSSAIFCEGIDSFLEQLGTIAQMTIATAAAAAIFAPVRLNGNED